MGEIRIPDELQELLGWYGTVPLMTYGFAGSSWDAVIRHLEGLLIAHSSAGCYTVAAQLFYVKGVNDGPTDEEKEKLSKLFQYPLLLIVNSEELSKAFPGRVSTPAGIRPEFLEGAHKLIKEFNEKRGKAT